MRKKESVFDIFCKSEWLLIACTAAFLCFLLGLSLHDRTALAASGAETERAAPAEQAAPEPLDLNAASQAELESLPGIGQALARRILDYRALHGAFETTEDLLNVSGIGAGKLAALEGYITVKGGTSP